MERGAATSRVRIDEVQAARVQIQYSVRVDSSSYAGRGVGGSSTPHAPSGQRAPAPKLIDEAHAITEVTGTTHPICTSLVLAAWRGQETRALELIEANVNDATAENKRLAIAQAEYARAVLYNGFGRYDPAFAAARRASEAAATGLLDWVLCELVEAAVRSGRHDVAVDALERLEERTSDSGADWALGIRARARALIEGDGDPDGLHTEALDRLAGAGIAPHLARAQLSYGEWLRRAGRRVDAREQLRAAKTTFDRIGAHGFGERAQRELDATGETVRKRTDETRDELTPQEKQIARLAAEGDTNPEIGARMFLSPRTVEWHLRKVFMKLGIRSRRELRTTLPALAVDPPRSPDAAPDQGVG